MSRPWRRLGSMLLALALGLSAACSSSGGGGDCYLSLSWHGVHYVSIQFAMDRQHLAREDIKFPGPFPEPPRDLLLGEGSQPVCGNEGATESVEVYQVPGVSPETAIMNGGGNVGLRRGADVPPALLKDH